MLLAQAAGEYVGLGSVLEGMSGLWNTVEYQLSSLSSSTYVLLALGGLVVMFFFRSRR